MFDDLSISNVLLIESFSFNLLFVTQLCNLSFTYMFNEVNAVIASKKYKVW
uniref:Uncharacterized protein n=1 Tax=Arundo donax TaxID=35708 RepID=A0A0A8ZXF2_ARUDO